MSISQYIVAAVVRRSRFDDRLRGRVWPRAKRARRHPAEAVVRPLGVVRLEPRVGDLAHLLQGVEEIRVEDLFAKRPIEPLDEGVLIADEAPLGGGPTQIASPHASIAKMRFWVETLTVRQ